MPTHPLEEEPSNAQDRAHRARSRRCRGRHGHAGVRHQLVLKFEVKFSPNKVGTKKKPQAITLFTRPYYDTLEPDADAPFAWKQARIFFPKEGVFNGKYFPSCPATKLTTEAGRNACKKAEIGKVDAKGFALGLVEPLKVKLYNLPGGKGIALYLQGDNPVIIDHVVSGILTKINDAAVRLQADLRRPADLIQPAPGAFATALDFKVTIPAARSIKKGREEVSRTSGPPAARRPASSPPRSRRTTRTARRPRSTRPRPARSSARSVHQ